MPADIFRTARKDAVYYEIGVFDDDRQKKKYVRAPFEFVHIQSNPDVPSQQYFMPLGMGDDISQTFGNDAIAEKEILGREGLAWHTLNQRVLSENKMGDWANDIDTITGMHMIGMI